jgi:glycosyltransferase involved in cell wall biosynthesis
MVAGEGELRGELMALASSLGIASRVNFIGRCDDVPALLAASEVCVLTSTNEGFSNSILEYMAAGRPVVATDAGGASEAVVEGKTGFLVPSDDDRALADKLAQLLNDPDLARSLGDNGRKRVIENFSAEMQLAMTVGLYERLLSEKGR